MSNAIHPPVPHIFRCIYFLFRAPQDLLQDSSARLQAAKDEADAKNLEIVAELDKFRRAFAGDTLGWAAATDEEGKPCYYNSETGEQIPPPSRRERRGCTTLRWQADG